MITAVSVCCRRRRFCAKASRLKVLIRGALESSSVLLISARFVTLKLRDRFVRRTLIPPRLVICHKCRAKSLSKSQQKCPIRLSTQKFLVGIRHTRLTARNQFSPLSNLRKHLPYKNVQHTKLF